jgi:hypothetical protein
MSFANLKSYADLAGRRSEAARLLQVSIDNETYLEGKMKKFQDPRKIDEVPPQYKTYAELVGDNIALEQLTIKNLSELKIPFDAGSQIAQFLSSIGKLPLFNASFPTIKADIMKRYNVRLLDVDFLKNYLNRFFTHLDTSYGFTIDRETGIGKNVFSSVSDAKAIIPTTDGVKGSDKGVLTDLFDLIQTAIRVVGFGGSSTLLEIVRKVMEAMPTQKDLNELTKLDEPTKRQLLQMLSSAFTATRCPVSAEVIKSNNILQEAVSQAQFLIGSDELSQNGRDTYQVNLNAVLSQIELQFRACGDEELAVLTGVREAIRKGEALVELGRKAKDAGEMALVIQEQEIQDIARDALEPVIGQIIGFQDAENEIIRRREYEEDLADDIVSDAELRYFDTEIKRYINAVEASDLDVNYALTMEGLSDIVNSGVAMSLNMFLDEPPQQVQVSARLRAFGRRIMDTLNRTGRSIEELYELVGGKSEQLREIEADADIWIDDSRVRRQRGGEFNPEGREMLRDTGVGGAAQEGRRERREEAPTLVPYETWATIHRDLASKYSIDSYAIQQVSLKVGGYGVYPDGSASVLLPADMTPDLRRALKEYQKADEDFQAERRAEQARPAKSAEQQEREDAFQRQQDIESKQRQLARGQREENKLRVMEFINARNLNAQALRELVSKVNGSIGKYPQIQPIKDKKQKQPLALIEEIATKIVELTEAGDMTILSTGRPVYELSSKGVNFGVGVKRRIGMGSHMDFAHQRGEHMSYKDEMRMNPFDRKKFLQTDEGREYMNRLPAREKIMDRKFIEEHSDAEEGMGLYKMTRIPVRKGMVKKKIGGGIAVQSAPTYAEFGKYAIHLPQLHNKNTLNIKYKSLGAIPTLKPITISDDFKDFIMETLEKKSVNERALKKLPSHEISYFERAVAGAGLLETFKMKRSNTEEEKIDLNRFNILRGELIAGNNSDKLVKELRSLIVKFLNTGRIHKAEGMNLLQELSVL